MRECPPTAVQKHKVVHYLISAQTHQCLMAHKVLLQEWNQREECILEPWAQVIRSVAMLDLVLFHGKET